MIDNVDWMQFNTTECFVNRFLQGVLIMNGGFMKFEFSAFELLENERPELTKLYMILKRKIDFSTGISGKGKNKINTSDLKMAFNWSTSQGRKQKNECVYKAIERGLNRLEKIGLIKRLGKNVFEICLEKNVNEPENLEEVVQRWSKGGPEVVQKNSPESPVTVEFEKKVVQRWSKGGPKVDTSDEKYALKQDAKPLSTDTDTDTDIKDTSYLLDIPQKTKPKKQTKKDDQKTDKSKPPQELVDFIYTDEDIKYCSDRELAHPSTEIDDFKDYYLIRPMYWHGARRIVDWKKAFQGWMRRQKKWADERNSRRTLFRNNSEIREKPKTTAEKYWSGFSFMNDSAKEEMTQIYQGAMYEN